VKCEICREEIVKYGYHTHLKVEVIGIFIRELNIRGVELWDMAPT
jgi:hypothetical protein